jgi:uncharacterized protein
LISYKFLFLEGGDFFAALQLELMTTAVFSLLVLIVSYFAGLLGALTGLGGGIVIIPALVLLFKVNIHYAMGASLISVIATSSGASVAYLREGYTNLKIGILLESGAVIGALVGAYLVYFMPTAIIAIILGAVLIFSAFFSLKRRETREVKQTSHPWAIALGLEGHYPTPEGEKSYSVQHVPLGIGLLTIAGLISGLIGIGAGALKVLAMDQAMRLPYKVSTTTSNFIIGITATVSSGIYLARGYIDPIITFPVLIGVVFGAFSGAKLLTKMATRLLRILFAAVIFIIAIQMIYKGILGQI